MDPKLFRSLAWRNIGPHRGGRVVAVAGHPTEKATFYFGGVGGGVWKTTNAGSHWENITDGYLTTSAIGAIAVSESDPNVIYVGTGEATIRGNVSHGDGVYKSTDGGASWTNVGLSDTRHIGDVIVHPKDPDTVYVAALGHAWGTNEERGVFRSKDGGANWEKVLYKSDRAGAVDISIDASNPRILYATIFQVQRHPHALVSGGEDSGLWRSFDGGDNWEDISRKPGMQQEGIYGKIGVAASAAKPGRVWAIVEHEDGALYRSDDYGDTWTRLSEQKGLRGRPWYYMHIYADPSDADTVWILSGTCWKSIDGGKSFADIPVPHGDNHDLWIDPEDSNRMIEGNDGGANVTFDGARSWSTILNQPTAQFYHVAADHRTPYNVYGSQQDNWAMMLPNIGFEGAISWKDYVEPGGGESGYIVIRPEEPYTVFGGGIGTGAGDGRLLAWNPSTRQARNVTAWPESVGSGAINMKYRFQWTFPIELSPHDSGTVYVTSQYVHKTTNDGQSWELISPDLTRNDPDKLQASGGPLTDDNSGAEVYCTIFAFRECVHTPGVMMAGSDDGLIHISKDGGENWKNVTPPDLPTWSLVSIIDVSPHQRGAWYVAATAYKMDDTRPFLYKTTDNGETWTKITNGIPDGEFTRVIREDPNRRGLLYAGTETGIWISFDDGDNWQRFDWEPLAPAHQTLPVTPIHDLIIKDKDLLVATHGRSFWILDDLSPLYQISDETTSASMQMLKPRDTIRFKHYGRAFGMQPGIINYKMTGPVTVAHRPTENAWGTLDEKYIDAGENPPQGVILHYWLGNAPGQDEEVKVIIKDSDGNAIRTFSSASSRPPKAPANAGANRLVWDFRADPPTAIARDREPEGMEALMEAWFGRVIPPVAVPGTYTATLQKGGEEQTVEFEILPDPRIPATQEDLEAQYDLKRNIRDRISELNVGVNRIRKIKKQVDSWQERDPEQFGEAIKALLDEMKSIEDQLVDIDPEALKPGPARISGRLAALAMMVDEADARPTDQDGEVYDKLAEDLQRELNRLDDLLSEEVAALNRTIRDSGVDAVTS
jgi:photosystem II stability/assembly factor-like uncharacterized protein